MSIEVHGHSRRFVLDEVMVNLLFYMGLDHGIRSHGGAMGLFRWFPFPLKGVLNYPVEKDRNGCRQVSPSDAGQ